MKQTDEERTPYNIRKGDLVVAISRSLNDPQFDLSGIGFVLEAYDDETFKIYWRDKKVVRKWEFGSGYLKRLNKA